MLLVVKRFMMENDQLESLKEKIPSQFASLYCQSPF